MATRENQGLQIALIVFLMITVVLAISTYYFFRQAEEQTKVADAAKDRATQAEAATKSKHYQVQAMKLMLGDASVTPDGLNALKAGLPADDNMKQVDTTMAEFLKDMQMFDETVPPENRNYRTLPKFLLASLMKRSSDLSKALDDVKAQFAAKDALTKATTDQVKVAMDGMATAKANLTAAEKTFADQAAESNKQKADIQAIADKNAKETETVKTESDKKIAVLQKEKTDALATNKGLADKLTTLQTDTFERPHGQVTFVNLRNNTVYINLGRADGLQRQVTFSVYDPAINTLEVPNAALLQKEEDRPKGPKRKASIEVVQVLDDHLSEARILEDSSADPILPGDNIFTPAWRPGQKLEFALVGKLDLNGDRISDREKVKNMIAANGGVVTCELVENAKTPTGAISVNTRYLVIGDRPDETTDDTTRAAFNNILGAAERHGVQQVSIKDLVSLMGWKGTDRTVKLGSSAAPEADTKKKEFRTRTPGAATPAAPAPSEPAPAAEPAPSPF